MSSNDEAKKTADVESDDIDTLKEEEKEKLAAAEEVYKSGTGANMAQPAGAFEVQEAQSPERKMAWVPGLILIGLGVIFLLNNVTDFQINNWWALFILIPAIGSFSKAADAWRDHGEFTRDAWGALVGGMILTLIASAFLFNLDWGLIWPVFLIIGGMGLFLGALKSW